MLGGVSRDRLQKDGLVTTRFSGFLQQQRNKSQGTVRSLLGFCDWGKGGPLCVCMAVTVIAAVLFCCPPAWAGNMRMIEKRIAELKVERARAMKEAGELPADGTVMVETRATPSATADGGYSYKVLQKSVVSSGPMPPPPFQEQDAVSDRTLPPVPSAVQIPSPPKNAAKPLASAAPAAAPQPVASLPPKASAAVKGPVMPPDLQAPRSDQPQPPHAVPPPARPAMSALPDKTLSVRPAMARPYTVQLISAKNRQRCLQVVAGLRDLGEDAFSSPVHLPGKGDWTRINIGSYETLAIARKQAQRLKEMEFPDAFVVKAPFALLAAMASGKADLLPREEELRQLWLQGYVLSLSGDKTGFRLLVGSYQNKQEAAAARSSFGPELAGMAIVSR